jgi:hypothetical protein
MYPRKQAAMLTLVAIGLAADGRCAGEGRTSLTNPAVRYTVAPRHYVPLRRGPITAVVVDNEAVDVPELPKHRAGYNGVAVLRHERRPENLFVAGIAGLNFEHIHDGTVAVDRERFEPRRCPMQLRVVDSVTVELHQPPTVNWKLESCGRYQLLADGVIEYTFECIPRAGVLQNRTIGLFWANYISQPEDGAVWFHGRGPDSAGPGQWVRAVSPRHGVESTHPPAGASTAFVDRIDPRFSLTLVNHRSRYVYTEPWCYGGSHGMAFVQIFRARDGVWLAQSPSGGGQGNPAWDFQWFVPECRSGQAYCLVMRALYVPFESRGQLQVLADRQRRELEKDGGR